MACCPCCVAYFSATREQSHHPGQSLLASPSQSCNAVYDIPSMSSSLHNKAKVTGHLHTLVKAQTARQALQIIGHMRYHLAAGLDHSIHDQETGTLVCIVRKRLDQGALVPVSCRRQHDQIGRRILVMDRGDKQQEDSLPRRCTAEV